VAVGLRGVYPTVYNRLLDAMPASWRREEDRVEFVVVERDGADGKPESVGIHLENPTPTTKRIFRRSHARRQTSPLAELDIDSDSDSEDEDDYESTTPSSRPFTIPSATPSGIPAVRTIW
jgi:hypothetical protein